MVLADGIVARDEEHTIIDLAERLGVSEALAHAIVTTTLVRNRGNESRRNTMASRHIHCPLCRHTLR